MTVYFAHISDTHIGRVSEFYGGLDPTAATQRLIDKINGLPVLPHFVMHTGDLVTDYQPAFFEEAAQLFSQLKVPIYFATGNHDRSADLRRYMTFGPKTDLLDDETLCYTFEAGGEQFLVLDSRAPDEMDPQGMISAEQLAAIEPVISAEGPPLTVFIHHPVLPLDAPPFDPRMLLIDGETLHQALLPARTRLRGVFHGHIHQPLQSVRDGIMYSSVASAFALFSAWPWDDSIYINFDRPPGFNFVHCLPNLQTIVHQHTVPRP